MTRRVIVAYDWTRADGDCVELTVLGGDPDDRFLLPFGEVDAVTEAMQRLVVDIAADDGADE